MKNNLKKIRSLRGYSLQKLADMTNYAPQYLQKIETGERRFNEDNIKIIAKALACSPSDLMEQNNVAAIPLVGYVGAGTTLRCENIMDDPVDWIDPLTLGFTNLPVGTFLIEVKGKSMYPAADDGDYLICHDNDIKRGDKIRELIDRRVAVVTKDGLSFFKILKQGTKKDRFHLLSFNTPEIIENVEIKCALPIRHIVLRNAS